MSASDLLLMSQNQLVVGPAELAAVRRYCRLAAMIPVLLLLIFPLPLTRVVHAFANDDNARPWLIAAAVISVATAVCYAVTAELRLRAYDLKLSPGSVTFEYGSARTHLPFTQVQLIDRETSPLLSRFNLCRCNLHTAGGLLTVSPIPIDLAQVMEQRIHELRSAARIDA